jgi:hypothetical protein
MQQSPGEYAALRAGGKGLGRHGLRKPHDLSEMAAEDRKTGGPHPLDEGHSWIPQY